MSKSLTSSFKKLEGKFNSAQSRRENIMDGGDWDKPKEKLKDLNKKIRDEVNAQQHQTAIGKSNSKTSPIFFGKHAPQKDDFFGKLIIFIIWKWQHFKWLIYFFLGSDQDTSVTAYSDGADMQNSKNGDKDSDSEAEQKIKEELDKSMANLMAAMKDSKFDKK